ncbi:MAG: hypothetical protein K2X86_08400 [Cytophagaceae bacterium]|nr:hypothetical protein [Cytophagaceae bacterium]
MASFIKNNLILFSFSIFMAVLASSCQKKDYPCPGLGKSNEADISMFDENGKLKEEFSRNSRVDKSNGLMKKKKPKKLNPKGRKRV